MRVTLLISGWRRTSDQVESVTIKLPSGVIYGVAIDDGEFKILRYEDNQDVECVYSELQL